MLTGYYLRFSKTKTNMCIETKGPIFDLARWCGRHVRRVRKYFYDVRTAFTIELYLTAHEQNIILDTSVSDVRNKFPCSRRGWV
jgi:hypothetical protein